MHDTFGDYYDRHKIVGDPDGTAAAIAGALLLDKHQRFVLLPLIEAECEQYDRRRVRRVEAFERAGRKVCDPTATRASYLSERFALGDSRYVLWVDATVAEHEARIAFLEKMRGGITATINRHQAAVRLIRAHDAKCLGDIADLPETLTPSPDEDS